MFSKILVAIDNSDSCHEVVDKAISLASLSNTNLMFVNIISPFDEQYPYPMYVYPNTVVPTLHEESVKEYMRQWEELKQDRIKFLSKLCQQATDLNINAEFTLKSGEPGRMICELAQTWSADLIIIGRRGRTGLSELFLGSVSNYVLHHASCSVLTVQQLIKTDNKETQQVQTSSIQYH
ncbi:UspA domain-containing protein [Calothrix sp. NIES-4071]|nr:UspA domain-containing protein [Calothrix sp. NIES-4071]BAZ55342.1 UspA domain-containing protein [Calothrix sp. NIES-4105]